MADNKTVLSDKAWARWTALLLLAMAMFCSYIFMDVMSPIKNLVQSQLGWDNTAFGTMSLSMCVQLHVLMWEHPCRSQRSTSDAILQDPWYF